MKNKWKMLALWLVTILMMAEGVFTVRANEDTHQTESLQLEAPSALLMEPVTGQVLYEKNKDEVRSPASITKIMTLILIFDELEAGRLSMDEQVTTSSYAKSMGGSQVFLEEGEVQSVETLIKCIVIASGNDASVVMAERIAGSEAAFVKKMNQRAKELGMNHTHFEDCCGLTESENHYTTAYDVALMSRELILKYPKILEYSSIWMEDITHITAKGSSQFTLTNTNKLVRSFDGCQGLKTGSTSIAKYCVSAVAQKDELQLISVVMGAPDYKVRFADAGKMLHYGFNCYHIYRYEKHNHLKVPVKGTLLKVAECRMQRDFAFLLKKEDADADITAKVKWNKLQEAPVKKNASAGKMEFYLGKEKIGEVPIVYQKTILRSTYLEYLLYLIKAF
ncbi:MAG: D-alanyl-D-alanine carboxypeptidase [Lachnospiraceae bacterium]|nr:D-alanyl-D-alanine carboxypeptidase [Lachnospiraceae bacterium]MDD3614935.1 D-alanyl-D-alanine carboxypeptidase [Lachnospiraceae bacterium]